MGIALAVITLAVLGIIFLASLYLRRHGLAGVLYLGSARLHALADAVAIAQEQHRRSVQEYSAIAREATRIIQETL